MEKELGGYENFYRIVFKWFCYFSLIFLGIDSCVLFLSMGYGVG